MPGEQKARTLTALAGEGRGTALGSTLVSRGATTLVRIYPSRKPGTVSLREREERGNPYPCIHVQRCAAK